MLYYTVPERQFYSSVAIEVSKIYYCGYRQTVDASWESINLLHHIWTGIVYQAKYTIGYMKMALLLVYVELAV